MILFDMLLLGVEMLVSPEGLIAILVLSTVFRALARRFGPGTALRLGLTTALAIGFGFMAMAGQNAWSASNTVFMMPTVLAVLMGACVGSVSLLVTRAR